MYCTCTVYVHGISHTSNIVATHVHVHVAIAKTCMYMCNCLLLPSFLLIIHVCMYCSYNIKQKKFYDHIYSITIIGDQQTNPAYGPAYAPFLSPAPVLRPCLSLRAVLELFMYMYMYIIIMYLYRTCRGHFYPSGSSGGFDAESC